MLKDLKNKYLVKSVSFKALPEDLQTSIIQKLITAIFFGIFIFALGICSQNFSVFLLSIVLVLINIFIHAMPYYLATRNILIQISGISAEKKVYSIANLSKNYIIYINCQENTRVCVTVKKNFYQSVQEGTKINVYAVPHAIHQNVDGTYMITNPLLVTFSSLSN